MLSAEILDMVDKLEYIDKLYYIDGKWQALDESRYKVYEKESFSEDNICLNN